jgi:hypothetical protein
MRLATWVVSKEESHMDQRSRTKLVDDIERELALPRAVSYQDTCRKVCEALARRVEKPIELQFVSLSNASISGATALRADGTYAIFIAASPFWYHRLQILLHEFAHHLLGHDPVPVSTSEGLRRLLPHLPERLGDILATRSGLCHAEEHDAEQLADELFERLTARTGELDAALPSAPGHVQRVADALDHRVGRWDR